MIGGMRVWLLATVLGFGAVAAADSTDEVNGKIHFQAGERYYQGKQYSKALAEFTAGYELTRRAPFLLNIAQTYRALNEPRRARDFYRMFLELAPDSPHRADVLRLIAELDHELSDAAPPPVISPPPVTTPPPVTPPPVNATPVAPAAKLVAAPVAPRRSFMRRYWWIVPTAAVVVAGAAIGVYFAVQPRAVTCSQAENGCLNLSY